MVISHCCSCNLQGFLPFQNSVSRNHRGVKWSFLLFVHCLFPAQTCTICELDQSINRLNLGSNSHEPFQTPSSVLGDVSSYPLKGQTFTWLCFPYQELYSFPLLIGTIGIYHAGYRGQKKSGGWSVCGFELEKWCDKQRSGVIKTVTKTSASHDLYQLLQNGEKNNTVKPREIMFTAGKKPSRS